MTIDSSSLAEVIRDETPVLGEKLEDMCGTTLSIVSFNFNNLLGSNTSYIGNYGLPKDYVSQYAKKNLSVDDTYCLFFD